MKGSLSLIVVAALLALAHGFPRSARDQSESAGSGNPTADTVLVFPNLGSLLGSPFDNPPTDDDDSLDPIGGFGGLYDPHGFSSFMPNISDLFRSYMDQAASAFGKIGGMIPWGSLPAGANTTSTTKLIDGHVVTINETTYDQKDDNGSSFVRIRFVDVKPQDDGNPTEDSGEVTDKETPDSTTTEGTKEATTPARSVETVEDTGNNEIPDSQVDTLNA